ncbi:MAG TPA: LacI family transcriptional regulator [Firmicutes bacterium]|nr:LacI family transcriptional regulator [Bacillota bacterium]
MKMVDIAKLAGVSIATVSRVINEPEKVRIETRKRVQIVLEQTNFVANAVARGLVLNSMNTIGVLVADIRDLYFANVTYAIERRFTGLGYNVLLSNTGGELGEKKRYLRVMLEKQVDGIILVGSVFKERSSNEHILAASESIPIVMVNSYLEGDNIYSVLCDDYQGIKNVVDYLVTAGRREIYYLNGLKSFSGLSKVNGFRDAIRGYGLKENDVLEIDSSVEGGIEGICRIISEGKKVEAVITGEDITAIGAMKELINRGYKIPDDVAVVGYNNSMLATIVTPSLTSVDNLQEAMANNSVQILYDVLHGKQVSQKTVLSPILVKRESAGV